VANYDATLSSTAEFGIKAALISHDSTISSGPTRYYAMRALDANNILFSDQVSWVVPYFPDYTGQYYKGPYAGPFLNLMDIVAVSTWTI